MYTVQGRRATVPWYMKWSGDMNQKTKIYIGGIFPNTGTKYVAPELAPGKIRYFKNEFNNFVMEMGGGNICQITKQLKSYIALIISSLIDELSRRSVLNFK